MIIPLLTIIIKSLKKPAAAPAKSAEPKNDSGYGLSREPAPHGVTEAIKEAGKTHTYRVVVVSHL